jgi:hypothetical protein
MRCGGAGGDLTHIESVVRCGADWCVCVCVWLAWRAWRRRRGWLRVYAQRLAELGAVAKARELCTSLLGPPHTRRAQQPERQTPAAVGLLPRWHAQVHTRGLMSTASIATGLSLFSGGRSLGRGGGACHRR